ncbi:MAG: SpoIIE family protein phosphatase, partial [Myxococcota bacterium]
VAKTSERHHGMGTTIVAAYFEKRRPVLHLAHVGDSRCYRLRDGHLELLTHDHTLVNDVLELQPDLDPKRAAKLPRHVITRALGMSSKLRVSVRSYEVRPADRFLLCSDGLTDDVEETAITDALRLAPTPDEQVRLLIDLAKDAGAQDNVACMVIGCDLAPGAVGLMKAPTRTRPTRRHRSAAAPVPARASSPNASETSHSSENKAPAGTFDDDYPEIIIIGGEPSYDEDTQVHVVPPSSASPDLLDAVHPFVKPPPPLPRRRADDTEVDLRTSDGKPLPREGR